MKNKMIMWVIGMILSRIDENSIKKWVGNSLDLLETKVKATKTQWDDLTVLPMIKLVRSTFLDENSEKTP